MWYTDDKTAPGPRQCQFHVGYSVRLKLNWKRSERLIVIITFHVYHFDKLNLRIS